MGFAHRRLLRQWIRRIEQIQLFILEVGSRKTVRDQHDLPVGRVLTGEHAPGQYERRLNIREMRMDHHLGHVRIGHVHTQPHDGIMDGHRLGHHLRQFRDMTQLREAVHLYQRQMITRIFTTYQSIEGQGHLLAGDVLTTRTHRTGHVHDDRGRRLGIVPRLMDLDVVAADREPTIHRSASYRRVGEGLTDVEMNGGITELVGPRLLEFDGALAHDRTIVTA